MINDGRGHEIGDRFLCATACRLLDTVRTIDSVARFGGDEFVVLIEDVTRPSDVTEIASRVVEAMSRPIVIEGEGARIGASVGVAMTGDTGTTFLVRLAL